MNLRHHNISADEYTHIVEPYILDRLQHGFTDTHFEINIKRFADLYGYQHEHAQKHLGVLIRNLSNKEAPSPLKLAHEVPKSWIESYQHNLAKNSFEITFSNHLSKLLFNVFKDRFVQPKPRMSLVAR